MKSSLYNKNRPSELWARNAAHVFLPDSLGSPTIAQSEAHARPGAVIARLTDEGQSRVDDTLAERLHELNPDIERAVKGYVSSGRKPRFEGGRVVPLRGLHSSRAEEAWLATRKNLSAEAAFNAGLQHLHRLDPETGAELEWRSVEGEAEALLASGWVPYA